MAENLIVASKRLGPGEVQAMTRDLVASINRHTEARAAIPEGTAGADERGDPITLGMIALSFVTSGAAVALFQVIKAYFERDESLEMSFERADGRKLTIKAENMSAERIDKSVALAQAFFADAANPP
jgi:septum formation topological specificity factor MinE